MGTQQALTTEQLELLLLICSIEERKRKEELPPVDEVINQSCIYGAGKYDELTGVLNHYGYIDYTDNLTIDGRQYVDLFLEDLQKKAENPNIVINNQFTLINIEALNAGINSFVDIAGESEFFTKVAGGIKNVWQLVKNKVTK